MYYHGFRPVNHFLQRPFVFIKVPIHRTAEGSFILRYRSAPHSPGDRGIDVIATATTDEGPQKQLIQAKGYGPATTVGSPEVQQYASLQLQADGVDQVTIATTGEFSGQAEAMAPDFDVIPVHGDDLLGMIDELDAADVLAEHLESVEQRAAVKHDDPQLDRGLLDRLRALIR